MEITIKRAEKQLALLGQHLEGSITRENGLFALQIGESLGSGSIRCLCFNKCMTAYQYDITLLHEAVIPLNAPDLEILYFAYCLEGDVAICSGGEGEALPLEALRTAVICNERETRHFLCIEPTQRLLLNLIGIDKNRYEAHHHGDFHGLQGKLRQLLERFGKGRSYLHLGSFNLKIGEQVKMLLEQNQEHDIASVLEFEGLCHLILANQISQYYRDSDQKANTTSLTQSELQQIKEVSQFIGNYPEVQHTIKSLCKKAGISPNKLQEGFKFMQDRTVSDYVRHVRVEKAEELLRTTDMNISEVVYSVGLTSRSYFCKIFKARYQCSPKHYKGRRILPAVGAA